MTRRWLGGILAAVSVLLAACAGSERSGALAATDASGTVTVFAAASLTDALTAVGAAFEAANPNTNVEFSFAGSSALREQILAGAPADVFASADETNMAAVVDAGAVDGDPATFATNELVIAMPAGNPAGVTGLADLGRPDLLVGLCAEQVPCGRFARETLARAGVEPSIDTNEPDVRSLRTKIEAGDLDVGIVYRSDAIAAGDRIDHIGIPAEANTVAVYQIAVTSADDPEAAAFVGYVHSADGTRILEQYGFDPA